MSRTVEQNSFSLDRPTPVEINDADLTSSGCLCNDLHEGEGDRHGGETSSSLAELVPSSSCVVWRALIPFLSQN